MMKPLVVRSTVRPRIRGVAGVAIAAIVATAFSVTAAAADTDEPTVPRAGLVAEYLFSQTGGAELANSAGSGVGAASVVNASDDLWTGSSLLFTGGAKTSAANWVRLPNDLLTGKDSATITVETKFDASMASNWHFLWNIGSDSTAAYYFASLKDTPRTAITTGGGGGEINARGSAALIPDRWYSVTSVIDGTAGTISLYIDGEFAGSAPTALKPSSITAQTVNAIGRAPYADPFYKGEVATFRVYDRALSAAEIADVSAADARLHADAVLEDARAALAALAPVTIDDSATILPGSSAAAVSWSSSTPHITIGADGRSATVSQPIMGSDPVRTTLTATANVRGLTATRELPVTIRPAAVSSDDYGYMMVHFIENAAGYAEKIYLDISRGDNPEQWDPLNGGQPILASQLGTTGVRDPYLTRNPETGRYYIIATDLRVFGGDSGSGTCTSWCHWSSNGSTDLVVWESDDLIAWGQPRTFNVALDAQGQRAAELGMAWAPEATWVDGFYDDGSGAFVVYWSSNVYPNAAHTGSAYSQVLWGATTDFTQDTYTYGGALVDAGADTIDTTMIQDGGNTYRITKDNGAGKGIYMESTTAERWWEQGTIWTTLQTRIGAGWAGGNAGGVEGPAVFKSHATDRWYLYVDVIPTIGYRPMVTAELDAGWTQLNDPSFSMAPHTKHGGVVSLTKAQYDSVRSADAAAAVADELDAVEIAAGSSVSELSDALPSRVDVVLAYGRGAASQPITWETASVDLDTPGSYLVEGVVRTIGANFNTWTGTDGSTAWNAPDRVPARGTAVTVTAEVIVTGSTPPDMALSTTTRCVAGKVVLVTEVRNNGAEQVALSIDTSFGEGTASVDPGTTLSRAFTTRLANIDAGQVSVTASHTGASAGVATAEYGARSCAR